MNSMFHFGDSYGLCAKSINEPLKHFVEISADTIGYKYVKLVWPGMSNEMIFNSIISSLHLFKRNDIIFVNFSFWVRGCYWDENFDKIKSTNNLFNEIKNIKLQPEQLSSKKIQELQILIDYYLNMTEDYNRKLFTLINSIFVYLKKIGIKIYYIFVDDDTNWSNLLLTKGSNLKFENGFAKWLQKHSFHNEEESHYSAGIQNTLTDFILNNTNNFTNKSLIIEMNDDVLNKNLIIKDKKII